MRLRDKYKSRIESLLNAVMHSSGDTKSDIRRAVAARVNELAGQATTSKHALPSQIDDFVDKIARNSYLITDEDFDMLREQGYSEDAILEVVYTAAVAAGVARLNQAMRAMGWETINEA